MPDNPKTAMIEACFYDPHINRTYGEMADHYDTAVLPARPRKPRDKAKVEAAVRIVERWLLGRLRHRRFHSLAEVNAAIAELLVRLNEQRVLRYVGRTRRQLFEELDLPQLKPLPAEPCALAEWRAHHFLVIVGPRWGLSLATRAYRRSPMATRPRGGRDTTRRSRKAGRNQ